MGVLTLLFELLPLLPLLVPVVLLLPLPLAVMSRTGCCCCCWGYWRAGRRQE